MPHEGRPRATKRDGSASTARTATKRSINIDAQDAQDFSGNNWLAVLSIRKPAPDHRPSRLPAQKPLVLFILCILCIDVHEICRFPGAVAVRSKWRRWPGLCQSMVRAGRPRSRVGFIP